MSVKSVAGEGGVTDAHPRNIGRPPASRAGDVEARILRAATLAFLERGFEAATFDQIAVLARAGKATLYARYSNKEALFTAVIRSNVERALAPAAAIDVSRSLSERLQEVGTSILLNWLEPMPVALMRVLIAAAPRMPDLVRAMDSLGRDVAIGRVADAIAPALDARANPAVMLAAAKFIELIFMPHAMRAMLGDDLDELRAAVPERVEGAIDFLRLAKLVSATD